MKKLINYHILHREEFYHQFFFETLHKKWKVIVRKLKFMRRILKYIYDFSRKLDQFISIFKRVPTISEMRFQYAELE